MERRTRCSACLKALGLRCDPRTCWTEGSMAAGRPGLAVEGSRAGGVLLFPVPTERLKAEL